MTDKTTPTRWLTVFLLLFIVLQLSQVIVDLERLCQGFGV